MKEKTLEKLSEEIKDWQYPSALPAEWFGYKLTIKNEENGDMYDLFTYENAEERRSATAYFHEETMEYKFRVKIGLTEFCQMRLCHLLMLLLNSLMHYLQLQMPQHQLLIEMRLKDN